MAASARKGRAVGVLALCDRWRTMSAVLAAAAIVLTQAGRPAHAAVPRPPATRPAAASAVATGRAASAPFAARGTAPASMPGARTLHFPPTVSLGVVSVEEEAPSDPVSAKLGSVDGTGWRILAPGKGDLVIPAGHRVRLVMTGRVWEEPGYAGSLVRLGPDGIHSLALAARTASGRGNTSMDSCMVPIATLTGLRELDLGDTRLSMGTLRNLAKLRSLETLTAPANLTRDGLAEIVKVGTIRVLHLSSHRLKDADLLLLQQLPQLEELSMPQGNLADPSLANVARLAHLRHLGLDGKYSPAALASLGASTSLKSVLISNSDFGDEEMRALSQIGQLESLQARGDKITDRGIAHFAQHKAIRAIEIGRARTTNAALQILGQLPAMEEIRLDGRFTDEGVESLAGLKNLKVLSIARETGAPLTDRAARVIAQFQKLERLGIGGVGITDEGIAELATVAELRELSLMDVPITDRGMEELRRLNKLQRLMIMPDDFITMAGVNELNQIPSLHLIQLDKIRKEGTLNLPDLKHLEWLSLTMDSEKSVLHKNTTPLGPNPYMDNEDIRGISGLERLAYLTLGGAAIDDAGMEAIARLPALRSLQLHGPTRLTDKALAAIGARRQMTLVSIGTGDFTGKGLKALENQPELVSLMLLPEKPFDRAAVRDFTQRSRIPQVQLQP